MLGRVLTWEGHIPVHRHDRRAAQALQDAQAALAHGRSVLLYPEGGLPHRKGVREAPPRPFHPGLFHLAHSTGAPVVPIGQAGARALASGGLVEQVARLLSAPLHRPKLYVHVGAPLCLGSEQALGPRRGPQRADPGLVHRCPTTRRAAEAGRVLKRLW